VLVLSQYVEELRGRAAGRWRRGRRLLKDRIAEVDRFVGRCGAWAKAARSDQGRGPHVGRRERDDPLDTLTPRERGGLGLTRGRTNRAIAD
jgi:hypothetical protein